MSGIGSINSNPSIYQSIRSAGGNPTDEDASTGSGQFDARITNALQQAGIDPETADALKADLKAAFEKFRTSGGNDPEELKSAINSVFEQYGLNAEDILGARVNQAGFGGEEAGSATGISSLLGALFSKQEESGALSANSLLDGLIGLDASA